MVSGNIKVLLPLSRELLLPEPLPDNPQQLKYRRGNREKTIEKRIFGVLTKHQVGHIPNINICFNDEDDQGQNAFGMDTYAYKSLSKDGILEVDYDSELYKQNILNDYKVLDEDKTDQTVENICTQREIEMFHQTLFMDLYRRDRSINFNEQELDKKYFIVPIKLVQQNGSRARYKLDRRFIQKVARIAAQGYTQCQPNILDWMKSKRIDFNRPEHHQLRDSLLEKWMLVKEDKPNSCYNYFDFCGNLKQTSARDFALKLKCSPEELNCQTAYELLYSVVTRFKSIIGYRELIEKKGQEDLNTMKNMLECPIILMDPIKTINQHSFSYSLKDLKRNPKAKMNYKKAFKAKNELTTSQGRPIFNTF